MTRVHVPTARVGREGRMDTLDVEGVTHGAEERGDRNLDTLDKSRAVILRQVEGAHVSLREIRRQEAEPWNDRRPSPRARLEIEDLDLERVAGLCSIDR